MFAVFVIPCAQFSTSNLPASYMPINYSMKAILPQMLINLNRRGLLVPIQIQTPTKILSSSVALYTKGTAGFLVTTEMGKYLIIVKIFLPS